MTEEQRLDLALWHMLGHRNATCKRRECFEAAQRIRDERLSGGHLTQLQSYNARELDNASLDFLQVKHI